MHKEEDGHEPRPPAWPRSLSLVSDSSDAPGSFIAVWSRLSDHAWNLNLNYDLVHDWTATAGAQSWVTIPL